MLKTNNVPVTVAPLISLGTQALAGAIAIGPDINLTHNTAAMIAADLYDLTGDPATPLVQGKQAKHAAQKPVVKLAYANQAAAIKAGIEYCRLAIGALKPVFGPRWNTQWSSAGFIQPSLALPRDPVPMLIQFREYFNANPTREVAAFDVTSARAQLRLTQIQQAQSALAQARAEQITRKGQRDISLKTLRNRLSGLRGELDQLLSEDDGRWYDFGFRRPADGQFPDPVEGLTLTAGASGSVLATWESAALADDYRVSWRPSSSTEPATAVGLVGELQFLLTDLPSGVPIIVGVSARNGSGETAPTETTITVP